MKKVILLLCFIPVAVSGQVFYDFERGSLSGWRQSVQGHWAADSNSAINGEFSLHHVFDNPVSGTDQTGLRLVRLNPSKATTGWTFLVRHGCDPSSSNNWCVFIMSDYDPSQMYPGGLVSGYAVGVNVTDYDDTLRLWKFRRGAVIAVKSFPVNWQNDIGSLKSVKIEIERTLSGAWHLIVEDKQGTFNRSADCYDPELFRIHWFGVNYKYSATRDRLLWIDDVSVTGRFETSSGSPAITDARLSGDSSLTVSFNDEISPYSAVVSNFSVYPACLVASEVIIIDPNTIRIKFPSGFPNKTPCRLVVKNLCNPDSVCTEESVFDFIPARAEPGDIVISEIMAEPSPPVSLPETEFIEITNTSEYTFRLNGWRLLAGNDYAVFPDVLVKPGDIRILCSQADTAAFSYFGKTTGLRSFPNLNDGGECLGLINERGTIIHCVSYSGEWYGDGLKSEGGWSLEMIDTRYPFYSEGNWTASQSMKGGTPGHKNSVSRQNPDIFFKGVVNVFPADSSTVLVTFSEPVSDPPGVQGKIFINGVGIKSVSRINLPGTEFRIETNEPLSGRNIYLLTVQPSVTDYAGNFITRQTFRFGLPEEALPGDILFNELLFNPFPGDPDYIEVFNNSEKIIDANRLSLVSVVDETNDTSDVELFSDTARCFMPGTYYAVTTSRERIISKYPSSCDTGIFEVTALPSMPHDKGHLLLLNRRNEKIDEVRYSEKMHFSLLSGYEGIALEKIRPGESSMDPKNWHSAAETSWWGTPGKVNSVFTEMPEPGNRLYLSSSRITPDNDGLDDMLVMDFNLEGNSHVMTILIFNETGNLVRRLVQNMYTGKKFSVVWDGSSVDGTIVSSGIYVILIRVFDETGRTYGWKKACAVIR